MQKIIHFLSIKFISTYVLKGRDFIFIEENIYIKSSYNILHVNPEKFSVWDKITFFIHLYGDEVFRAVFRSLIGAIVLIFNRRCGLLPHQTTRGLMPHVTLHGMIE